MTPELQKETYAYINGGGILEQVYNRCWKSTLFKSLEFVSRTFGPRPPYGLQT